MQRDNLWLTSFLTRNGFDVKVRYLHSGDAPQLLDVFNHMGEESRYQRFNQSVDGLSAKRICDEALQIAEATLADNRGLIAFADLPDQAHAPIAVARYVHVSPEQAEVAMSVRDDMQGQGVGTTLLNLLLEEAKSAGLQKLVGMLQNNNMGMWVVFDRMPYEVKRLPDGVVSDVEIDLTRLKKTS